MAPGKLEAPIASILISYDATRRHVVKYAEKYPYLTLISLSIVAFVWPFFVLPVLFVAAVVSVLVASAALGLSLTMPFAFTALQVVVVVWVVRSALAKFLVLGLWNGRKAGINRWEIAASTLGDKPDGLSDDQIDELLTGMQDSGPTLSVLNTLSQRETPDSRADM